jgi:hypothetical protein
MLSLPAFNIRMAILQQLQSLIQADDERMKRDLDEILSELTWSQEKQCYFGSQRAVARITGMAQSTLGEGLGMSDRSGKRPKLLKWLAGEGISAAGIQREWQAGAVSDRYIAKLIVYAASEANSRTPEARRWLNLITGVGFRGAIHQMKGREDLLDRATARAKNLVHQRRACLRIEQQGKSFQHTRAELVKGVTTMVPQHLTNVAQKQGIKIKGNWRSHADAATLTAVSMTEDGYSITGNETIGVEIRDLLMRNGWSGEVEWSQERISCDDARNLGKLAKRD